MGIKKIRRTLSILLLLTAIVVTQVPVSDISAQTALDFQVENRVLVKYAGTTEQVVSVPDQVKTVGETSFAGHNELVKVTIGNDVEKISNTAFADCNSLRTVVIGDSVKEIESGAFSNCPNLTSVTIGTGLRELGNGVFAGCDNLKDITVAGDNTGLTYRGGILYNRDETIIFQLMPGHVIENYAMPGTVTQIRGYAFWGNPYLKSVTLGSGLTDVPEYAFSNCFNLSQITLPYLIRSIGAKAFEDCVNLQKANIPASVTRIHETAFDGCPRIEFTTEEGTYGAEYAAGRDVSQVALTEQSEVEDSAIVRPITQVSGTEDSTANNETDNESDSEANDTTDSETNDTTDNNDATDSEADTRGENNGGANAGEVPNQQTSYSPLTVDSLIGQSFIVSGRAVVFIDNASTVYMGGPGGGLSESGQIMDGIHDAENANNGNANNGNANNGNADNQNNENKNIENSITENTNTRAGSTGEGSTGEGSTGAGNTGTESTGTDDIESNTETQNNDILENLMGGNDKKGFGFPKYTIVEDRIIADQAYYQESRLISYEIPQGIVEIGDFSFARTGLQSITIPDGTVRIGYAAFYHCDNLRNVTIPDTVTEIEPSAFEHTAWLNNWKSQVGQDYLIVGDGILLAYSGKSSVVTIPNEVKSIASGVFKDHTGITAVNLPKGLLVIGEEAFAGCRNLKTINGGEGVVEIRDRAFQDCILSQVTIAENVRELGLKAFDLGEGGTKTVTFAGNVLPQITTEKTAMRLANSDYRDRVFGSMEEAFIKDADIELSNTVLDESLLGFGGTVFLPDGTVIRESSQETTPGEGNNEGVSVRISSRFLTDEGIASAAIAGENGSYILKIVDSDSAAEQIRRAYKSLYGNQEPNGLLAFDISLYEQSGNAQVTRLGKQYADILIPKPASIGTQNIHVVCVDTNGQLEEVPFQIVQDGEKEGIRFTASHFSAYGIYQYGDTLTEVGGNGRAVIGSLSGKRDASPDTGDFIHPKWLLAFGLLCAAIALYFYRGKDTVKLWC